MLNIEEMANFCKRKGFVYPSGEIYGGQNGFFDFGPLGVELNNNVKAAWWKEHVHNRDDVVGIDGAIVTNPKTWEASGHVDCFVDVMVSCTKCKSRFRADHVVEEQLAIDVEGAKLTEVQKQIDKCKCSKCKGKLGKASAFKAMLETNVGTDGSAYLRPETAQLIFNNFKLVADNARMKLPFGIAQVGKAFRNEISPRNFLFRVREFEQAEIEYFVHPDKKNECPFIEEVLDWSLAVYSSDMQLKGNEAKVMKIKDALKKKVFKSEWHAYWLATEHKWFVSLGCKPENFRLRQHKPDEKAHYSDDCWDLEYKFPWGFKELQGIADRGTFDLDQHIKHSGKDLSLFDDASGKKVVPVVIAEPSLGLGRLFLVFMFDSYNDDKERGNIVLHLHPKLAPTKVTVLPLVKKNTEKATALYKELKQEFVCSYDKSGSVGRRYARADECGTPYCVTVDFDEGVTIRDRDSTKQIRVGEEELVSVMKGLLTGAVAFEKAGKLV